METQCASDRKIWKNKKERSRPTFPLSQFKMTSWFLPAAPEHCSGGDKVKCLGSKRCAGEMPQKSPALSLTLSHPPVVCSSLGTSTQNPALWVSVRCKRCTVGCVAEFLPAGLKALRWCRQGVRVLGVSVWLWPFHLPSPEKSLEIGVYVDLCLFPASLYFTHEVQQRHLMGARGMKLGQHTNQVFTKCNFSSFTVLSWKRPVLKTGSSLPHTHRSEDQKVGLTGNNHWTFSIKLPRREGGERAVAELWRPTNCNIVLMASGHVKIHRLPAAFLDIK